MSDGAYRHTMIKKADLGATGGAVWSDTHEWQRRLSSGGCVICVDGGPFDIIAQTASCWVTAEPDAPLPGYVCVVARTHVVEPYELPVAEQAAFWVDSMTVAKAVADVVRPVKTNYEIHGNTLPHLHLHLFPRHVDDPYVGGPVDPRKAFFRRSEADLAALRTAIVTALASGQPISPTHH